MKSYILRGWASVAAIVALAFLLAFSFTAESKADGFGRVLGVRGVRSLGCGHVGHVGHVGHGVDVLGLNHGHNYAFNRVFRADSHQDDTINVNVNIGDALRLAGTSYGVGGYSNLNLASQANFNFASNNPDLYADKVSRYTERALSLAESGSKNLREASERQNMIQLLAFERQVELAKIQAAGQAVAAAIRASESGSGISKSVDCLPCQNPSLTPQDPAEGGNPNGGDFDVLGDADLGDANPGADLDPLAAQAFAHVLANKCTSCHKPGNIKGGLDLTDPSTLATSLGKIRSRVSNGTMPPANATPLDPAEKFILRGGLGAN